MNGSKFARLEDVVLAEEFPEADLALRRGQHIDRDSGALYAFLIDGQEFLEAFYRRFGCELIHSTDGFFYLLPTNDRLGRRHLSPGEMLVGQALTLLYLDPSTVQQGGLVTRDHLLGYLAGLVGTEALLRLFNPKRRRFDERIAEEAVRNKVGEALRRLASLGFLDLAPEGQMRLRPALMRFAEPVRGSASPEAALERLVAKGELVLTTVEEEQDDHASEEPEDEDINLDPAIYDAEFEPLEDEFETAAPSAPQVDIEQDAHADSEDEFEFDDDFEADDGREADDGLPSDEADDREVDDDLPSDEADGREADDDLPSDEADDIDEPPEHAR